MKWTWIFLWILSKSSEEWGFFDTFLLFSIGFFPRFFFKNVRKLIIFLNESPFLVFEYLSWSNEKFEEFSVERDSVSKLSCFFIKYRDFSLSSSTCSFKSRVSSSKIFFVAFEVRHDLPTPLSPIITNLNKSS